MDVFSQIETEARNRVKEVDCAICMTPVVVAESCTLNDCDHRFHFGCLGRQVDFDSKDMAKVKQGLCCMSCPPQASLIGPHIVKECLRRVSPPGPCHLPDGSVDENRPHESPGSRPRIE
jgi:hypothetical protein